MRRALSIAIVCGVFIISCQGSDSSVENTSFDSSVVTNTKPVNIPIIAKDSPVLLQNTTQTVPASTVSTPVTAGLNPAHGQPGHRCDIAVGAPLNSAPAQAATKTTPTVTQQPVVMNTTNTTPVKTAPGMNPPHGQPGHRCDIAVGAPLNSAPVKPVTIKTDSGKTNSPTVAKKDTVPGQ